MKNQNTDFNDLENKNFILDISGMNSLGQGVGKIDGLTIFVAGAITGEKIEAKVTELKKNYCIGKINKIIEPSPYRTAPFCEVFDNCGGCSLQHISYDYQLEYKTGKVRDEVERISGIKDIKINKIIGMENPLNYRNKAEYFINTPAGFSIGFYARGSHEVVEHKTCHICTVESNEIKNYFKELVGKNTIFNLKSLTVRKSFGKDEAMVIISAYENKNANNPTDNPGAVSGHNEINTSIFNESCRQPDCQIPFNKKCFP